MKRRRFVLTPEARSDLKSILLDIAEENPELASRLRRELYEGLQMLGQSPAIGHYHDELLGRAYRFWNFYSYVVAYTWQSKPIQVIRILHGARDLVGVFQPVSKQ